MADLPFRCPLDLVTLHKRGRCSRLRMKEKGRAITVIARERTLGKENGALKCSGLLVQRYKQEMPEEKLGQGEELCLIGGMWGEFTLRRDHIMGGARFSMLDCPNALAWTFTTGYPPDRDKLVVHLTINREINAASNCHFRSSI